MIPKAVVFFTLCVAFPLGLSSAGTYLILIQSIVFSAIKLYSDHQVSPNFFLLK